MRNKSFKHASSLPPSLPSDRPSTLAPLPASLACQFAAEHDVCTLAEVFALGKFAEAKLAERSRLERGLRSISFRLTDIFSLDW